MKIVINKCYGGFSLSPKAVKLLSEKQGKPCYFFKTDYTNGQSKYIPMHDDMPNDGLFWHAFTIKNPNDASWEHNITNRPSDRTDPLLIQVVEELGEEADGSCAELKVIDIPDDVEYTIEEYDGNEHIAEKHKTWN